MLEELELPYRFHKVNVHAAEQYSPDFLRLNPNNKVPVIVDHDATGGGSHTVFESGAILFYLAEKTGRLFGNTLSATQRSDAVACVPDERCRADVRTGIALPVHRAARAMTMRASDTSLR